MISGVVNRDDSRQSNAWIILILAKFPMMIHDNDGNIALSGTVLDSILELELGG